MEFTCTINNVLRLRFVITFNKECNIQSVI